jgi:hypothetical protein
MSSRLRVELGSLWSTSAVPFEAGKDDAMDQDPSLVPLRLVTNVRVHHDGTQKGSWNWQKLCLWGGRIHGGLACRTDSRSQNSKSGQVLVRTGCGKSKPVAASPLLKTSCARFHRR